jgi:hypothetical protein
LEVLGIALLDFSTVADLVAWLAAARSERLVMVVVVRVTMSVFRS